MTPEPLVEVLHVPAGGLKLTPVQWRKIEQHLDTWKAEVLAAARRHPARSYRLGAAQVTAFADLLGNLNTSLPALSSFGGIAPTATAAVKWAQTYTLHELDDALNVYIGQIKDALLYGLRGAINPTQIASLLYNATKDAKVNWRRIARTEAARANAEGRLDAIEAMGYDQVWCPPHMGSCRHCKRILENQVFRLDDVRGKSNFGNTNPKTWIACCPLHPHCRHGWLPYEPEVYEAMQDQYRALEDHGLDEAALDDLFDSSGQLKEGAEHDPRMAGWLQTQKTDPHAELLALAVERALGDVAKTVGDSSWVRMALPVEQLERGLHQRAVEPDNVLSMVAALKRGDELPPIEVRTGPNGEHWIVNGQHRVWAHQLAGLSRVDAWVKPAEQRTDLSDQVREVVGKVHDPSTADGDLLLPYMHEGLVDAAKSATSLAEQLAWGPAEPVLDDPGPALDATLFDGARLRGDVELALDSWWTLVAGLGWEAWSRVRIPMSGRPVILVEYSELRRHVPAWKHLADVDLHLALVAATLHASRERELAPGLPLEPLVVNADQVVDLDSEGPGAIAAGWDVTDHRWIGGEPDVPLVELSKTFPDYSWASTAVGTSADVPTNEPLPLALADRLVDEPEVAKLAVKQGAQPNSGVEHWITIHPHGDAEKGQPVLVRNNADGTMTVIGGAGGNLNMMRLDPSRRVDRGEDGKPKGATGSGKVEQDVTEAEAEAKQAEREKQIDAAREALAQVKEQRDARTADLHDYLREHLDVDLDNPELSHQDRQKLMAKLRQSAMRTLAYGPIQRKDVAQEATGEQLDLDSPDAPKPWPGSDPADEQADPADRNPRPQVAMEEDHAKQLLDALLDLRELQGISSKHRRVINGEERGADALQIDWSAGSDTAKRDERRAKVVEQQLRTDLSRNLLETADDHLRTDKKGKKAYDAHFKAAHVQGGFDSIDGFTNSILGESVLSKEAYNLLGVAGAAQLVGHTIQQRAKELGKQGLDLDKVQAALKSLTDEQEAAVNERGIARMQRALRRAGEAYAELTKTKSGESLYTSTMAASIGSMKTQEAKRGLGMMIGGLEACSALKTALDRKAGEKVKVGGFSSPATIKEAAARARVKVGAGDIVRVGSGNYTLSIDPEKLSGLVRPEGKGDAQLRERLEGIRSGKDLDAEIRLARTTPGMSDVLDDNQARGKLFMQAAGSGVLAFDPGVGKTHTAIAVAMEKMHAAGQKPGDPEGKHKVLIVCPGNVARSWANTIRAQGGGHTCDLVGEHQTDPSKDTTSPKVKAAQLGGTADFTIVSYDSLKNGNGQKVLRQRAEEGRSHSMVIADELQLGKDDDSQRHKAVEKAVDHARAQHGDDASFMGLTGTPIEKDVSDLHAMQKLVKRAKGKDFADKATFRSKFGSNKRTGGGFGQDEHIARGDKIREFRKGLDEDIYRLSAADAGNDLGEAGYNHVTAELTPEHRKALLEKANALNAQIADYHSRKEKNGGDGGGSMPSFGGRSGLLETLYNHPDSGLAKSAADSIAKIAGTTFHFDGMPEDHPDGNYKKGDHAGEYAHKQVVFGANEHSKALFGVHPSGKGFDPEGRGGLAGELRKRGVKVFVGHGQMGGDGKNEASYKAFVAHKGPAVFVTNDKNNAGISMQFGDNRGGFQHGATHMHHFTRPVNNATIQQREARILRKGACASFSHTFTGKDGKKTTKTVGAAYHVHSADTPVERKLEETLEAERRTQDLAANSEQRVAGSDTLAHHLKGEGVPVPR